MIKQIVRDVFSWGSLQKQRQKLSGWTAQIVQHEVDHLFGKII